MNKILLKFILVGFIVLNTSCATVLNSKFQKVSIHTPSTDSKVYVNDKYQGEGDLVVAKMRRDQKEKQVRIERPGYKDIYDVHYQDRKSPLYIMSWIPFGVTFYAPLLDYGPKSFNYKKDLIIEEHSIKSIQRDDSTKYLFLKNTSFDLKKEDLKFRRRKKKKYDKNKEKFKNEITSEKDINYDNTIFSSSLNKILLDNNFIDTTSTIFRKKTNSAYLSAKVKKVSFEEIYEIAARSYKNFIFASTEIEWTLFDLYDQEVYKNTITSKSGKFSDNKGFQNIITNSIDDAIQQSFYKFLSSKKVQKELVIGSNNKIQIFKDYVSFKNIKSTSSLENAIESTVTIKVDKGHGSGCVISNDGYILTNFHVVSGENKKIEVLTKSGNTLEAKIIRKSEEIDLALLKVDGNFNIAYEIPDRKQYGIGEDVFVIGTPNNIELGQTLSKGIISGAKKRKPRFHSN